MNDRYFSIVFDMTKLSDDEQRAIFAQAQKGWADKTVVTAGWEFDKPDNELKNQDNNLENIFFDLETRLIAKANQCKENLQTCTFENSDEMEFEKGAIYGLNKAVDIVQKVYNDVLESEDE